MELTSLILDSFRVGNWIVKHSSIMNRQIYSVAIIYVFIPELANLEKIKINQVAKHDMLLRPYKNLCQKLLHLCIKAFIIYLLVFKFKVYLI